VKQLKQQGIKKKREIAGSPPFKKQLTLVFLLSEQLGIFGEAFSLRVFDARREKQRFTSCCIV